MTATVLEGMRELRCDGCKRLVGFTTRPQKVPVQCTDPFCFLDGVTGPNEERDSFIEHLATAEKLPEDRIGKLFGITRQAVHRVLRYRWSTS